MQFVERLVVGDGLAWRTFLQKYGRLIRARVADVATSFGQAQDSSAIDDATADVVTALLNNDTAALRAYSGRSSLSTYVAVIATRSATRGFAAKRIATVSNQDDPENVDSRAEDPSARVMVWEQTDRIHQVLSQLPPKQRTVVEMFHLQGCSYLEVSECLKMPMGSVGVTLRRAEAKLKTLLEPDDV